MTSGSYSYRAKIGPTGLTSFENRSDYLSARPDNLFPRKWLCQVIDGQDTLPDGANELWYGFPWITLVFGSGCLEVSLPHEFTPESVSQGVRRFFAPHESVLDAGDHLSAITREFTKSLVADRLTDERHGAGDPDYSVDELTARTVAAAALLSRLYHRIQALGPYPLSRSKGTVARLTRHADIGTIDKELVQPLKIELDAVIELTRAEQVEGGSGRVQEILLQRILANISSREPTVSVDQLRLLTDLAWQTLTREFITYPGWTDLMIKLLLSEGVAPNSTASSWKRPRFPSQLEHPEELVRDILTAPTAQSWEELAAIPRGASVVNERHRLYAAAATVLAEQVNAMQASIPEAGLEEENYPMPSAFVTSFDIELEMALWRAGQPFWTVLPVHVYRRNAVEVEPCWIIGETVPDPLITDPTEQLQAIRSPRRWRVLLDDPGISAFLRARPTIVHLSGSPLITLPSIRPNTAHFAAELRADLETLRFNVADGTQLGHAVTVDEYLAHRLSEAEMMFSLTRITDAGAMPPRSLHSGLLVSTAESARFWLALGVAIDDPAVRHRVVTQISYLRIKDEIDTAVEALASGSQEPDAEPEPNATTASGMPVRKSPPKPRPPSLATRLSGVAVNSRVDDDEALLLFWLGLDVVRDRSRAFTDDLLDYAAHLRETEDVVRKRSSPTESCRITDRPA